MNHARPIQVIAVTSGKGGVGKTHLAINLSLALAELQRRVVLLDADLALGSVDQTLGLTVEKSLADVIAGEASMRDVIADGPGGIRIVPAPSGVQPMSSLNTHQHAALIHGFNELSDELDVMVVDTAPGISDMVTNFVCASREVIMVVCDEPASIAGAHALIRLLSEDKGIFRFRVVCNRVRNAQEGKTLFGKLNELCEASVDVALHYLGHVPFDESMTTASQKQKPLLELAPRGRAAQAIRVLAQKLDDLPPSTVSGGRLEFFVEQLVRGNA
ncbi:MAG: MinD/ParA family protein [Cellvibrionaceae bacterium]